MANKRDKKAFSQQKRYRRRWISFMRVCRYGFSNFIRNAWLTVAATAVMTITLIIILLTVAAQNILSDTTTSISKKIDRSIYLKTGTTKKQASDIISGLEKLSNVESVNFISTEEGKEQLAGMKKGDVGVMNALSEATNKIPSTVRIVLKNPNDTSQIVNFVKTSKALEKYIDSSRQPSFMSDRKSATDTIAAWTRTARRIGVVASVLFTVISTLIIFNTIRMAIYNRKDEIEMMKLIGADKSFIRGPFIIEAIFYGIIAAFIACGIGYVVLFAIYEKASVWGLSIDSTIEIAKTYGVFVIGAMLLIGSLIGTVSSMLATRRYLKV